LAKKHSVRLSAIDLDSPTAAWERIITEISHRSKKSAQEKDAAYEIEAKLRKSIVKILKTEQEHYADLYAESSIGKKINDFLNNGGHLVSLNFDQLAYFKSKKRPIFPKLAKNSNETPQAQLLYKRIRIKANGNAVSMVWHPHGSILHPQSIRLGLRDYGLIPSFYEEAFGRYKAWERNCLSRSKWKGDTNRIKDEECHAFLLEKLDELDRNTNKRKFFPADTWVTRFMLLPVVFIGVGLSKEEIGLHWLLAQRERNFLKRKNYPQPVIIRKNQKASTPFGSHFHDCESWDEAWQQAFK
jgi:hypothetical protein